MPQPRVVLVGLPQFDLGAASGHWRVVLLDDAKEYLDSESTDEGSVVVVNADLDRVAALVREARRRRAAVIAVSERDPQTTFEQLLELEADTFLTEPIDVGQLTRVIAQELRAHTQRAARATAPTPMPAFVGRSDAIQQICAQLSYMAPSRAPVLVTGESGTGKELVARAIHRLSPRRYQRIVAVNCGAIPAELIESELFGHERGAFTGADSRRIGCFEAADGGTLFLDEVGELAPNVQVKLLRAIETGAFTRVGGSERIDVDVRIVAATNRNLEDEVADGAFREDLYYRLNVLAIALPPLREHPGDVRILWDHFVETAALEEGTEPPETTDETLDALERHPWPGNVRELENAARRAVAMRPAKKLTPRALPQQLRQPSGDVRDFRVPGMTLDEIERVAILRTYELTKSVRRTAELLDVSERKIFYRLKQYREEDADSLEPPRTQLALVEDDSDLRLAMRELLAPSYQVSEFESAEELLESLLHHTPDVIVSDVRLPTCDGFELLDALHERGCRVPVILMSAYADEATRARSEQKGALAFLEKPIDAIALGRCLERATARSATRS